jgi:hypothetical protein
MSSSSTCVHTHARKQTDDAHCVWHRCQRPGSSNIRFVTAIRDLVRASTVYNNHSARRAPAGCRCMPLTGQLLSMVLAWVFRLIRSHAECQSLTQISIIIFVIHQAHVVRCLPLSHVVCSCCLCCWPRCWTVAASRELPLTLLIVTIAHGCCRWTLWKKSRCTAAGVLCAFRACSC